MNFKFVLPLIYINFDILTKFEVNQIQIGHSILKKLQKIDKMGISQLPKCHSLKSLLLLHFRINDYMDFAHTYGGRVNNLSEKSKPP